MIELNEDFEILEELQHSNGNTYTIVRNKIKDKCAMYCGEDIIIHYNFHRLQFKKMQNEDDNYHDWVLAFDNEHKAVRAMCLGIHQVLLPCRFKKDIDGMMELVLEEEDITVSVLITQGVLRQD